MSSNTILAIVIVLLLGFGAWYFLAGPGAETSGEQGDDAQSTETMDNGAQSDADDAMDAETDGDDDAADDAAADAEGDEEVVRYTDEGFVPETLTVAAGTQVRFVNESGNEMWVASAVHPSHAEYDGTTLSEHCADSLSDSLDQCDTGETYSFVFNEVGSWNYHNHVRANDTGVVVVQ